MPSPGNRIGTQAESHPCQRDQFSTLRDVPRVRRGPEIFLVATAWMARGRVGLSISGTRNEG